MVARAALRGRLNERFVGHVIGGVGGRCQHDIGNLPRGASVPARPVVLSIPTRRCTPSTISCGSFASDTRTCCGGRKFS